MSIHRNDRVWFFLFAWSTVVEIMMHVTTADLFAFLSICLLCMRLSRSASYANLDDIIFLAILPRQLRREIALYAFRIV